MLLKGNVTIGAPRQKIRDFLTNSNRIDQCAPRAEKIEPMNGDCRDVSVGLGGVKARFNVEVEVLALEESDLAKLKAHGIAMESVAGSKRDYDRHFMGGIL